jgi:hypothetical protein
MFRSLLAPELLIASFCKELQPALKNRQKLIKLRIIIE